MAVGTTLFGMTIFSLLTFVLIGGPVFLADWRRKRRQETFRRQIALTDAIDGQLGMFVSPLVSKRLWGPWEVRVAVPFSRPEAAGRILAIVDEMLTGVEGMSQDDYRVVLTPRVEDIGGIDSRPARWSANPWTSHPFGIS